MSSTLVEVRNVQKSYGDLAVLKGVDLEIAKAEVVSILGASGAGKTTLLQLIGTLDKPDAGNIIIDSVNVSAAKDSELAKFRNQSLGFVFQFHQLLPEFTALENVCIPGFIAKRNKVEVEKEAMELMHFLGVGNRQSHKPSALSGGEQQRVAVARALINRPKLVLADEPSGNLDTASSEKLHELFFDLRERFSLSFVIVTHNEHLASLSDRRLYMKDGKLDKIRSN